MGRTLDQVLAKLPAARRAKIEARVASAIVAISSIHLLQVFMNAQQYENGKLMWLTFMHLVFIASAVFLGLLERISSGAKKLLARRLSPSSALLATAAALF